MILEGIVTTQNSDGEVNVAPMGPIVDATMQSIVLRPFKTSTTYSNLKQHPFGVLHVTDDVLLLARTAVSRLSDQPPTKTAEQIEGRVLLGACRWYEFEIVEFDDAEDRTTLTAAVVHSGNQREFFGFNRAKHSILEMAILATRLHILDRSQVALEFEKHRTIVDKTGGDAEHEALQLLQDYFDSFVSEDACAKSP